MKRKPVSLALFIFGALSWLAVMFKSGLIYSYGMGFWGPNGHDGIWHIAVIKSLAQGSWRMPIFAGETLKNYHVGFDLIVAWLHKLTFIPVVNLYFQIIPPILALLIGLFAYKFVYTWRRSRQKSARQAKLQALWATFFVYFAGSFGWMVTFFRSGGIGGESLFWSQQSISTLINPPFALSILILFIALVFLMNGVSSKSKSKLTIATFLFGVLIQIKVYAGILTLCGLFVAGCWQMFRRKGTTLIKVFAGSLVVSILFFSPLNKGAQDAIVFKPFWFLETMMAFPDRFYWPKFGEAMVNYKLGGVWIKGIIAYSVAFFVFVTGNLGLRLVSIPLIARWVKKPRKAGYIEIFLLVLIAAGITIPMFCVQRGTSWNTIQFMYYSLMFSGILAGVALGEWLESKDASVFQSTVAGLIVLLTIPTTIGTLRHYLPGRPPAKVSHAELEALKFLSEQPDGIVLTYPFDRDAAEDAADKPPRPLYLYESTAYVSAFSGKSTYLEDEVNLDITGYEWRERRKGVEDFLESLDHAETWSFLRENNITYVYWIKGQRARLGEGQLGMTRVFENNEVDIYRVD